MNCFRAGQDLCAAKNCKSTQVGLDILRQMQMYYGSRNGHALQMIVRKNFLLRAKQHAYMGLCKETAWPMAHFISHPVYVCLCVWDRSPMYSWPLLHQMLTDFQTVFTFRLSSKFIIKSVLKIPPHPKCVSALPCEICGTFLTNSGQ